ncbi:MAG: NADP-dependent oxidoreductase [Roseibium sp.]|uniref:NADP-dependent oxidoreductase n=1 Tax=Roseibium sp. TaxID=1936156 RepID=UPI00261F4070|nr:NADP-dependent oxidoreductase [Roseibium sp.]MCV0424935.1 NADP-dependent oxidoreductase [Roseibium sp.]
MNNMRLTLKSRPEGRLGPEHFDRVEEDLGPLADGKARIRVLYVSLDPAMRGWVSASTDSYLPPVPLGDTMRSLGVGVVEDSKSDAYKPGDWVTGMTGWTQFLDVGPGELSVVPQVASLEDYIGILGLPGATAWYGLVVEGEAKEGQTLCVTGAAGSVGSLVGQIGKALGLRVIGIAGTQEKCDWLVNDLSFDAALNYRTDDLDKGLKEFAPGGIDLHFENVGGDPFNAALKNMAPFGRMIFCGFISVYNGEATATPPEMTAIVRKRLTLKGYVMTDHFDKFPAIFQELGKLMMEGKLKYRLDVTTGLENAPTAFNKLFDGTNKGKLAVKVADL